MRGQLLVRSPMIFTKKIEISDEHFIGVEGR